MTDELQSKTVSEYRLTELGLIPIDWGIVPLSKLVFKITKGTTPTTMGESFVNTGINFVKVEALNDDGTIDKEKFMHINEKTNEILLRSKLQINDVLYSIAGTIGRVSIVTKDVLPANTNQALAIIRPNIDKIDIQYLRYALINPELKNYLLSKVVHAVQANLSLSELGNCPIPVPDKHEQKKIAKILYNIDAKIAKNKQINYNLEAVGAALFRRWFVDFEFPNQEGKPYKTTGGKMQYNEELQMEIPENWTAKRVGDLAKINEHSINRDFSFSAIEYIDIDSVEQGLIKKRQLLTLKNAPSRAKRIVKDEDIIISTVRPNLKHFAFIQGAKANTIVSTGFAVISAKLTSPKLLYYHLTSDRYTNYLSAIADSHTSTYPSFNPDIIYNTLIAHPIEEKNGVMAKLILDFERLLSCVFQKIHNNNEQNSVLSMLRDALLPKLMSGKIRVPINKENVEMAVT